MKLNLNNSFDKNKAIVYFNKLIDKKAKIELSEIKETRSLSANAYMHVCIALMSIEWGNTLEEQKTDLKRACNFMHYEKKGKRYLKLTRDLDVRQCMEFIEFIRNYASVEGLYIPTSEEYLYNKFEIDREIERNKEYL